MANQKWRGKSPNAEKPYFWASRDAQDRALEVGGTNALAVYVSLCSLEARTPADKRSSFYASMAEVARGAGLSARRVGSHIRVLERSGLIRQYKPKGADKVAHQSCKYTILSRGRNVRSEGDATSSLKGTLSADFSSDNKESQSTTYYERDSSAMAPASPGANAPGAGPSGNDKEKEVSSWD